jgi:4-hydroxy-2-oxoheptanedioate aldolase
LSSHITVDVVRDSGFDWLLLDIEHSPVRQAIKDAIRRVGRSGKVAGILAPIEADARHWLELGCLFVAVGSDVGILARQSEALAAKFKCATAR